MSTATAIQGSNGKLIPRRLFPREGVSTLAEVARYDTRPRHNRRFRSGYQFFPLVVRYPAHERRGRHVPVRFKLLNAAMFPREMGGLL